MFAFAAEQSAAAEEAPAEQYQRCAAPWREVCRCGASAVLSCGVFYASTRSHLQLMAAIHRVPCAQLYCQHARAPFRNLPETAHAAYQHFPPQGSKAKLRDCGKAEGVGQRCALKGSAVPTAPPSMPALRCCLQNPMAKVGLQGAGSPLHTAWGTELPGLAPGLGTVWGSITPLARGWHGCMGGHSRRVSAWLPTSLPPWQSQESSSPPHTLIPSVCTLPETFFFLFFSFRSSIRKYFFYKVIFNSLVLKSVSC